MILSITADPPAGAHGEPTVPVAKLAMPSSACRQKQHRATGGQVCTAPDVRPRCALSQGTPALHIACSRFFPPRKSLALSRYPCLEREGKSSPFPKGFQLNFSSYISLWSLLPVQLHILALWRHSNVKHLPHKHFFLSKASTHSVTRTISLKHEERVRFLQTKELKISF